jgi:hypothetical protein
MVCPALGGGFRRGMGVLGWRPLSSCIARRDATVKGDESFVIFDGDFLFAAGQFSPPEAPNSRFWLHSGRRKLFPCGTTLPKTMRTQYHRCKFYPTGVNFDEEAIGQNWQERGDLVLSLVPLSMYATFGVL